MKKLFWVVSGEKWKIQRRHITPAVSVSSSGAHLATFNRHIRTTMSQLPVSNTFFDLLPPLALCKMNIFIETTLGSDWQPHTKQIFMNNLSK